MKALLIAIMLLACAKPANVNYETFQNMNYEELNCPAQEDIQEHEVFVDINYCYHSLTCEQEFLNNYLEKDAGNL